MDCGTCTDALSARLDGEDLGVPAAALEDHLAGCRACRAWEARAVVVGRALRVAPADPVPDLTDSILAAASPLRAPLLPVALRVALAMTALLQALIALDSLVGPGVHTAREHGAWELGLAAGLAAVVVRPALAAGLVPVVAALAIGLAFTGALDVAEGNAVAAGEGQHLFAFAAFALVWATARTSPRGSRA